MPEGAFAKPRGRLSSMQIMVGVLLVGLVFGFVGGLDLADDGKLVFGVTALAVLAVGCISMIPYWRRLDEAAREAHKDAWLWGGSAGYVAVAVYAVMLMMTGDGAGLVGGDRGEPADMVATGIAVALVVQSLCYFVAWGVWWLRRR